MDPETAGPEAAGGFPYSGRATIGLGLVVGVVFTLIQAIVVAVHVVLQAMPGGSAADFEELFAEAAYDGFVVAVATCATALVCTGLIISFVSRRRGIGVRDYLALKRVSLRRLAPWVLGILALALLSDWLTKTTGRPVVPEVVLDIYRTAGIAPLLWFAVVIAAPIFEEVFFRGFLFKGFLHSRIGPLGTILLTSLLWGAIHVQYDTWDLAIIFILGIFLGFARLKTGSIYTTITLHALVNLIATIETIDVLSREIRGFASVLPVF